MGLLLFRDPERTIIYDDNYLVSPADGLIVSIKDSVKGPVELNLENKTFTKVSIFMNVFNCHVNRSPASGKIEDIFYKPGKFLNASDKASEENERNFKIRNNESNEEIVVVQIAGLIARRIVTQTEKNQDIKQGIESND